MTTATTTATKCCAHYWIMVPTWERKPDMHAGHCRNCGAPMPEAKASNADRHQAAAAKASAIRNSRHPGSGYYWSPANERYVVKFTLKAGGGAHTYGTYRTEEEAQRRVEEVKAGGAA